MKYIRENATFRAKFRFKKNELEKFWKIDNDICTSIIFILVRKKGFESHHWSNEEGLSSTLKMCQIRGGFIQNVQK